MIFLLRFPFLSLKIIELAGMLLFISMGSFAQPPAIRNGVHPFQIQWISFDQTPAGKVVIKPLSKGIYSIEGEQRSPVTTDYVTIAGTFTQQGRELLFDGTIVSQVSYLNDGKPCQRKGPQVFKASGTRKYWRLQQMLNCDGETTDYIDIFF